MKTTRANPLQIFWTLVRNVGYLFVLFALALIVFTVPDQADDFIVSFVEAGDVVYYITVGLLLVAWSYITWYSSSIILDVTPEDPINIENLDTEKFNRFVAYCPFLILAITFFQAKEVKEYGNAKMIGYIILAGGLLMMRYLRWLDKRNNDVRFKKWPSLAAIADHLNMNGPDRIPTIKQELRFIFKYPNVRFYFREIGIGFLLLLILFCIPNVLIPVAQSLRPAAVIILSFCFITYVVTLLFYFHDIRHRPFAIIIVIILLSCSLFNDNTRIEGISEINDIRLTPNEAFAKWYETKSVAWVERYHTTKGMPVIFIATQGGGIRGELWTIECLRKLSKEIPGFSDQVFCIGGASGGTVGAVYATAFQFDTLYNRDNPALTTENLLDFAGTDCISPVTASFAFGENLQHFLPFPVGSLERSKIMMKAFSRAYESKLNSTLADSGLLKLYYPEYRKENFDVRVPSLFINGVLAETGQRIITSNLKTAGNTNFGSDIDFFDQTKEDISVATASLNCMRFPLLLSGGLFRDENRGKDRGHLADGGYRENTGLQAIYSLMCDLHLQMKKDSVTPVLLYFRNGNKEVKDTFPDAIRMMHDIRTPFSALMNVNGTSAPALGIMEMIEHQVNVENPMRMITGYFWLNNSTFDSEATYPLGLYMSDKAKEALKNRADAILKIDSGDFYKVKKYFEEPVRPMVVK